MQKLNLKIDFTKQSLTYLHEILSKPYSEIIRDATLFRFKRSVEIFWRLMKDYLYVHEGFVCESPKACMRMAFNVGLMNEEETIQALEMIDLRIRSEHVCGEEAVEEIYQKVGKYWKLMNKVCKRVVE